MIRKLIPGIMLIVLAGAHADQQPAPADEDVAASNRVAEVIANNDVDEVAAAINANDTNLVAAAIAANKTNLVEAAVAINQTNLIEAVEADEDAGGWESIFTKENRTKLQVNFYLKDGLFYEFRRDNPSEVTLLKNVFSERYRFTGRLGVKLQLDAGYFNSNGSLPELTDETSLRRLRFNTYGRTFFIKPLTYGASYGASNDENFLTDAYIWFHDIPYIKSLKIGVFKAPASMEYLQSSSTTPMMERAAPVSAFAPGERVGLQIGGPILEKRGTVHSGFFGKTMDDDNSDTSDSYSRFVNRATILPVWKPASEQLIHMGVSINSLFSQGDGSRFRARPESYLSSHVVDTGDLGGDTATTFGIESAWAKGSLSFQGEYFHTLADDDEGMEHDFFGGYILGSLFLTGETRPYNTSSGTFGRLTPKHNFSFKERQWGAWEWTVRGSYIDLTDGDIQGGKMSVLSTGLNCYLTKQNRLMLTLAGADVNKPYADGNMYFVQTRLQIEF